MTREFRILSERWMLVLAAIAATVSVLNLIRVIGSFEKQPNWGTGSIVLIWLAILATTTFVAFRQIGKRHLIRVEDGVITLFREAGKRCHQPEVVLSVKEDQVEFHLFTGKSCLSLSKKQVPPDLRETLSERVNKA